MSWRLKRPIPNPMPDHDRHLPAEQEAKYHLMCSGRLMSTGLPTERLHACGLDDKGSHFGRLTTLALLGCLAVRLWSNCRVVSQPSYYYWLGFQPVQRFGPSPDVHHSAACFAKPNIESLPEQAEAQSGLATLPLLILIIRGKTDPFGINGHSSAIHKL